MKLWKAFSKLILWGLYSSLSEISGFFELLPEKSEFFTLEAPLQKEVLRRPT